MHVWPVRTLFGSGFRRSYWAFGDVGPWGVRGARVADGLLCVVWAGSYLVWGVAVPVWLVSLGLGAGGLTLRAFGLDIFKPACLSLFWSAVFDVRHARDPAFTLQPCR